MSLVQRIPEGSFSSNEVAHFAGCTLRQLQWWDERSVITVRQRVHQRIYTEADRRLVSVVSQFRRKGISLQKLRRVLRSLQRDASVNYSSNWYVVLNPATVKYKVCLDAEQVMRFACESNGPVIVVEVPATQQKFSPNLM